MLTWEKNEKMILMKSFILSNFNCRPSVWHFCHKANTDRMGGIQKQDLRWFTMTMSLTTRHCFRRLMQVSIRPITIPPGHAGAVAPKCVPSPRTFARQKMPRGWAYNSRCPRGRAFASTGFKHENC